jgi:hypothetical protein
MIRPRLRTFILAAALVLLTACGLVVGGLALALRSPALLTRLAARFGYDVTARELALSPSLSGAISDLRVAPLGGGGMTLLCGTVTAKNSLDLLFQGEIDSLVLQNLKLAFRLGGGSVGGAPDLSLLGKLPKIRRLEIQNAEILLAFEGRPERFALTEGQLTLTDFSPAAGGSIAFRAKFALESSGDAAVAAHGTVAGNIRLAGLVPRPSGSGSLTIAVESGSATAGRQAIPLRGLTFSADLEYDRKTETLAIAPLRGTSAEFGTVQGAARIAFTKDAPWSANLSVASIDFPAVFEALKPLLPEEYRAWAIQGKGALETSLHGTYASAPPAVSGTATLTFSQGAFNSPDSTKAAQGVSGRIILKLQYPAPERKVAFGLRSEHQGGEILWGDFYANLAGRTASLEVDGSIAREAGGRVELAGALDLFQTGEYAFSASGAGNDWALRLRIANASHTALIDTLFRDYLKGLSPALATLSVTGTSHLEAALDRHGGATTIAGRLRVLGAALSAPDIGLTIQELSADLPFDLAHPAPAAPAAAPSAPGIIHLKAIERRRLSVDSLRIPLRIAQNRVEVPETIVVPFFGGEVRLYAVSIDDLLAPWHHHFGLTVERVDLGRLTRRLLGREFPGTINADLGMMSYREGRIASDGKAVIAVFGGTIEATNFFAEALASPARRLGGDFTFTNINLEELTQQIAIGKMTGIVQGSLKHAVFESGQPASFLLEIESVPARRVDQRISVDALQSISILGAGTDSPLNVWVTRIFKEYPYSKIGIRCTLRNDQFSIRGTVREGNVEYLVRRGFLRGVDVVNQNPDNLISFRDMQERIARIARPSQSKTVGVEVE